MRGFLFLFFFLKKKENIHITADVSLSLYLDLTDEAMRDWVKNLSTTYYLLGSAIGPHPVPTIVRDFQCVIGNEIKEQLQAQTGKLPDAVIASVGGGSHSIG